MAREYGEPRGSGYGSDDNRERWRDDDRERSKWTGSQGTSERDDERGFFERAGEEIRSWFSDDDDRSGRDYDRGRMSGGRSSWDRDNDRSSRSQGGGWTGGTSWERENRGGLSDRDRERSYGRPGYTSQERGSSRDTGRPSWDRDQGPSRGGYLSESSNRDRQSMGSHGENRGGFGGFREESDFRAQRRSHPQSWGEANRGENESLGYGDLSGSLGGFGNQTVGISEHDHYRSWRDREMAKLDRDYADYCREREHQFGQDFDSWRRERQSRSPSAVSNASSADLGAASNAGVGTTTASVTGSAGSGSAIGSATGTGGSIQSDTTGSTETADTSGSRPGSRSRS